MDYHSERNVVSQKADPETGEIRLLMKILFHIIVCHNFFTVSLWRILGLSSNVELFTY